jgi:hypothetical protein
MERLILKLWKKRDAEQKKNPNALLENDKTIRRAAQKASSKRRRSLVRAPTQVFAAVKAFDTSN